MRMNGRLLAKCGLGVLLGSLFLVLMAASASGKIITVDDNGPADHTRISHAVENATAGDSIHIFPGIYNEKINISKSLTIMGDGIEETIIDAGGERSAILILSDNVSVSHLTVRNGGTRWSNREESAGIKSLGNRTNISNVRASAFYHGFFLQSGSDGRIEYCRINGTSIGIKFERTRNSSVMNSRFEDNDRDLVILGTDQTVLLKSHFWNASSSESISIQKSNHTILRNNSIVNNGISISGNLPEQWTSHDIDHGNTVNGKPIHYVANQTGGSLAAGSGQIILANCSGVKISGHSISNTSNGMILGFSNNITVENSTFTHNRGSGVYSYQSTYCNLTGNTFSHHKNNGITMYYGSVMMIRSNIITNASISIHVIHSDNNVIIENTMTDQVHYGIALAWSSSNVLESNICKGKGNGSLGIWLWESNRNILNGNNVSGFNTGIELGKNCDWNQITNNTCEGNTYSGIALTFWYHTQTLYSSCDNNIISNNTCRSNRDGMAINGWNNLIENNSFVGNENGTRFWDSYRNLLRNNVISNNSNFGMYLTDSEENEFYNNTISFNRVGMYLFGKHGYDKYDRTDDYVKDTVFHNNSIFGNSEWGINTTNNGEHSINATGNWWGHDSGPNSSELNPSGRGDDVTQNVEFSPWLTLNGSLMVIPPGGNGDGNELEEEQESSAHRAVLWFLLSLLVLLFASLIVIIRQPETKGRGRSVVGTGTVDSEMVATDHSSTTPSDPRDHDEDHCEHCGAILERTSAEH